MPNKTRKFSKHYRDMVADPNSVWGKNPELESFWRRLALGKSVVLVFKDKSHKIVNLPKPTTVKYKKMLKEFEEDSNISAILSSNMSQDSYEIYLYPRAKDKSVKYVIDNYKKYFKTLISDKMRVP